MSTKFKKIRTIVCVVLITFSTQLWAEIQLVAGRGLPAPDFPEGFIYWTVEGRNASIGSSGLIAFSGAADISAGSTENNTNAVWTGSPGQLKAIIKENESIAGFPDNVLFGANSLGGTSGARNIIVNKSGSVAFIASLKGAGQGQAALLAHINDTTFGVIKTGDPAPDFPPGTFIQFIHDFSFSDAGMVIVASVGGGSTPAGTIAVWFHNFSTMTLLPPPKPGCSPLPLITTRINDSGEIVLVSTFINDPTADSECSTAAGVFKWSNSEWKTLLSEGENVPNMVNTNFTFLAALTPLFPISINDDGDVAFPVNLRNNAQLIKSGIWITNEKAEPKLLVLGEETLKDDANSIISGSTFPFLNFGSTNNGFSIVPVIIHGAAGILDGTSALVAGPPKTTQPYSILDETGESQLKLIARLNQKPPGFESNWFYSKLGNSPSLNRNKQFMFFGAASDAATGNAVSAIWQSNNGNPPQLKVMQGMKVAVNGETHSLEQINVSTFSSTTNGKAARISDNGHFLFDGTLSGGLSGLFLLLDDSREQKIFTLAEQLFPQFFSPANVDDRLLEGFKYRFYPNTSTYIGVKNGEVFVLGKVFGSGVQRIGTINETLQLLEDMAGS